MQRFYLVPIETIGTSRGPLYIQWNVHGSPPDPTDLDIGNWSMMDYGFAPFGLILARDISQANHDALILNADVYAFPEILDQAIDPQDNLDTFFETIGIPTDWLQPVNTYLEFLRQTSAMFQFNQRYGGIAANQTGELHSLIDDAGGLDARYNQWDNQTQLWFDATLESFGYPPKVGNPSLRQLMKQAGDAWGNTPFLMGGIEF
jgi:hypothetical protein